MEAILPQPRGGFAPCESLAESPAPEAGRHG